MRTGALRPTGQRRLEPSDDCVDRRRCQPMKNARFASLRACVHEASDWSFRRRLGPGWPRPSRRARRPERAGPRQRVHRVLDGRGRQIGVDGRGSLGAGATSKAAAGAAAGVPHRRRGRRTARPPRPASRKATSSSSSTASACAAPGSSRGSCRRRPTGARVKLASCAAASARRWTSRPKPGVRSDSTATASAATRASMRDRAAVREIEPRLRELEPRLRELSRGCASSTAPARVPLRRPAFNFDFDMLPRASARGASACRSRRCRRSSPSTSASRTAACWCRA